MKKNKIILVENDEDEQFFMKEGFEASGLFELLTIADDGNHLFDWLEKNSPVLPDIILSDLNMPGKNGYDILTEIRRHPAYSQISVIIISTSSAPTVIKRCRDLGATDYMVKPDTFIEYKAFAQKLYDLLLARG